MGMQYIKRKKRKKKKTENNDDDDNNQQTLSHPLISNLIESTIKYGLIDIETKSESECLLRAFKMLDDGQYEQQYVAQILSERNYKSYLDIKHRETIKENRIKKQLKQQKYIKQKPDDIPLPITTNYGN